MLKYFIVSFLFVSTALVNISCISFQSTAQEKDENTILHNLTGRLAPDHQGDFTFEKISSAKGKDVFEIESENEKIIIRGNNAVSMATGLHWYLKYYAHANISWNTSQLTLPSPLPKVTSKVRRPAVVDQRYYLNYCTFSYTMPFWDWERWKREIDWMALNGVNVALAMTGQEAVWQNTLKQFDFTDQEIKEFIAGPAFTAWWLMGNLEGWGGPISQEWIDEQAELQKKIINRMRVYGIEPVLQGFYGMVPKKLSEKRPDANIIHTGNWINFRRPDMLVPYDALFKQMAKVYYKEQKKLYGKNTYFGGDPFHEGHAVKNVNLTRAGQQIYNAMKQENPNPVWVLQAWGHGMNPKDEMIKGLEPGQLLILDLWAESVPQWGGVSSARQRENGFRNHKWVWNTIPNFGGNIGMYGKLQSYANDFPKALNHLENGNLSGIGSAPEGIETNPVVYDLIFEMAWRKKSPDLKKWIHNYADRRYGTKDSSARQAWELMLETVYTSPTNQEGTSESILCARPKLENLTVSSWGTWELYYDRDKLLQAWTLLLDSAEIFPHISTYQYDVVDLGRQVLANYAQVLYKKIINAYEEGDKKAFSKYADQFMALLRDQDELLSTRKEFLLGRWLQQADQRADNAKEATLFEWNARTLITVWANENSSLHDYSHREWAGLLKGFYLPRWKMFFDELKRRLDGKPSQEIDFYSFEKEWTQKTNSYSSIPQGNPITVAKRLHQKYVALF